ncbi:hypothetical protein K2173_010999 [Erythroxylum novogranatense]|uniref:Small auxin up regulated protein n=1 Tax=Erythroxylum novogranatense TaxID=1862640 RepID=A0AAV8T1J4_9ROSI|nr:hypothetical protein K2173_010999 [Erythroxylum novogranatense]
MASPRCPLFPIKHIAMLKRAMMKCWKSRSPKGRDIPRPPQLPPPPPVDYKFVSPCDQSPHSSPSGFLPVYVGASRARFLIPTRFLNFPIFKNLLNEAEEEYGFELPGGIVLPCEAGFFEQVLLCLYEDEKRYGSLEVDEFVKVISHSFSCKESESFSSFRSNVSLIQKVGRARR